MPLTTSAPADVYRSIIWHLREAGIPYLVGGTYALEHHAGLVRDTKDLDLFVRRADWSRIDETLAPHGRRAASWCSRTGWARRTSDGHFVDMIFAGGNGLVEVDDDWLAHGVPSVVLEVPVHLVAGRGDDLVEGVRHGARALRRRATSRTSSASPAPSIDWVRLLRRFGPHAAVLLVASGDVPVRLSRTSRDHVPDWVMDELWRRVACRASRCRRVCAAAR